MMEATPKFDREFKKWVIDVKTDDGEIIPVGRIINKEIELFEISKWDSKEQAEEWVKARPSILVLQE